jgi:broad specificity phosphatase PhoE
MILYAVRHGQTVWNAADRVCGRTDIPLTELGMEQADEAGKKLAGERVDVMLVSPMLRARQTADIIDRRLGVGYSTDERLLEQNYGKFEGCLRGDPEYLKVKAEFAYRLPGGESPLDLCHRVYGLIEELTEKYGGKRVLLVCHGGVCRMINSYYIPMTNAEFAALRLGNCEIRKYGC